jgi:hypothetical protein
MAQDWAAAIQETLVLRHEPVPSPQGLYQSYENVKGIFEDARVAAFATCLRDLDRVAGHPALRAKAAPT